MIGCVNFQAAGENLKACGLLLLVEIQGSYLRAVGIDRGERGKVYAGLRVLEGDGEHRLIQLLADNYGWSVVNGADMLVFCSGHSVFIADGDLQRSVSLNGCGVELFGLSFHLHGNVVQLYREVSEGKAALQLNADFGTLIVAGVINLQIEARLYCYELEDQKIDQYKGKEIVKQEASALFFLPVASPAGAHFFFCVFVLFKTCHSCSLALFLLF